MSTVFTKIIEGEIPGTFVWRDELCVAFMSINPLAPGHVLVVPIEEVDHWVNASRELAAHLMDVAHTIGLAQDQAFDCERIGLIVAGYEVPHTHVHVIPTTDMSQFSFSNAARTIDPELLEQWASAIREELRSAGATHVA
ncbi:MAG: HIT family protein [Actinobacteria bacterium]|nr:HIT family protein [Actinomycetota bacterium]